MKIEKIQSKNWDAVVAHHEIAQLQREHSHLMRKGQERELSPWEQQRLQDCLVELMQVSRDESQRKHDGRRRRFTSLMLYPTNRDDG